MELTEGGLLQTCSFLIKCCDFYGTLPYSWNHRLKCLQVKKEKWKLDLYRKWLVFSCIATFAVIAQIFVTWGESSMFVRSFSLEYISAFVMTFPSSYVNTHYPEEIVGLINSLIAFERRKPKMGHFETPKIKRARWWTISIVKITAFSTFSMIPFQLNAIVQPCFPVYFGYWLSNSCKNGAHLGTIPVAGLRMWLNEFLIRFGMCLLSFANWAFLVPAVMVQICLMMVKAHCICSYIQDVTRNLLKNENIYDNWSNLKEVQVMLSWFRRIYSRFVVVSIAAGGMFAQVSTLYLSIDLMRRGKVEEQKGMMIACTWVAVGMGLIFCFVYGTLGNVYEVAGEEMRRIKRDKGIMKNKWFRKSFKGYPRLRISLGEYNILERSTPVNIENRVVDHTIDFLLV